MSTISVRLPKGWPSFYPTEDIVRKLEEGKILSDGELAQLREDAATSERLEATDPDYMRAARRYRTQVAEDERIEQMRRSLEEKDRALKEVHERVAKDRDVARQRHERRREKGQQRKQECDAVREKKRNKLVERIALAERRALVRETIQSALVSQSRNDGHAKRLLFTDPSMLGDAPGPGTYAPLPLVSNVGPSFGALSAPSRKVEDPAPGPGSYDPRYKGGPAITFGSLASVRKAAIADADAPGPGAYESTLAPRKGGKISRHVVKSSLEKELEKAREEPGPGSYELVHLAPGQSSTMGGRTAGAVDVQLSQEARRPGPGTYSLPPARVRGGVMTLDKRRAPSLPAIAPGPGAYHQTPTIKQEREMEALSRQVIALVRHKGSGGGGKGAGKRALPYAQSQSAPGGVGRLPRVAEGGDTSAMAAVSVGETSGGGGAQGSHGSAVSLAPVDVA